MPATAGIATVIYQSKNGKSSKTFQAVDWLAQLTTHIPDRRKQTVRYYGRYSSQCRGMFRKADKDDDIPAVSHLELSPKEFRKNRVRLIQKIYEVDPLSEKKIRF